MSRKNDPADEETQDVIVPEVPPIESKPSYGKETLVGAEVIAVEGGRALVLLSGQFGVVPVSELTAKDITMVNPRTLEKLTGSHPIKLDLYPTLWRAGITDLQDQDKEKWSTFYRLLRIVAVNALKG